MSALPGNSGNNNVIILCLVSKPIFFPYLERESERVKDRSYVWVIDQACSVKMAGNWPSSFFCVFIKKKERGQYPAILTEQAWSIKDLIYGKRTPKHDLYACGTKPVSRAGKIASSCPLG